jgi:acyl-CoA thioester hydrolase
MPALPQPAEAFFEMAVISSMNTYALTIHVAAADIDRMGHVNNSIYLRWVEEAVHAHWAALATPTEFAAPP